MPNLIKNSKLKEAGFIIENFPMENCVLDYVQNENWKALDDYFLAISKPNGLLRAFLDSYLTYQTLEHIIAIRSAPDDEDGIWHDDGSRFLGFSLSLNLEPSLISGGDLRFKKKDNPHIEIITPRPYGQIILFLSGIYGYEHMVSAVTKSKRMVIAGWCG